MPDYYRVLLHSTTLSQSNPTFCLLHLLLLYFIITAISVTAQQLLLRQPNNSQAQNLLPWSTPTSTSTTTMFLRSLHQCLIGVKSLKIPHCHSWLILEVLAKRAEFWVKELSLHNIHFMFANATISFKELVSAYPGPLMLVSLLVLAHIHMQCPDPHFKKRHHKRRVVQKPLVDSIVKNLMPGGQVFIQSDVLEVAVDMRDRFDAESDLLQHIDTIDPSMQCDEEGWLVKNPMGIRTEREIHAEFEGAKIYRRLYQKLI
ncbi:uncharacterized protein LOC100266146 isoform X5 [Vitis vinifera]|uniref:uncharacterized protein LOC100266146 isoform X5 n=1 Tax=Vitis vinifera TaxID=29760 RepID=UPI0008FEC254|nr:uncharacterized protein LOC100266146 isoform X5 [Vitis vinifera]|eukprot:XP_019080962.1 PREDICTED: uncharacterized protein LOC100266146 isoform X4 [Vitis vinifera]